MPRKLFEDNTEAMMEESGDLTAPAVKQMVRWIAGSTDDEGHDAVQMVDAELTEWINKGYRLLATHYVGTDQTAIGVLYILVR